MGAVRGLLATLVSLLRERDVSHVAVAFDTVIESFRNEMFDGYKTGEGIEPDLFAQFELAERAIAALGVVVWSMVEFEADDGLATGAARFRRRARGGAGRHLLARQGPLPVHRGEPGDLPRSPAGARSERGRA